MRKKKWIILLPLMLLLIAASVWILLPAPHISVVGDLSPVELTEVKRAVRHEIWRGTLPNYSWKTLKHLPTEVITRRAQRIMSIEAASHERVKVTIANGNSKELFAPAYYDLHLKKGRNGWEPYQMLGDFGTHSSF